MPKAVDTRIKALQLRGRIENITNIQVYGGNWQKIVAYCQSDLTVPFCVNSFRKDDFLTYLTLVVHYSIVGCRITLQIMIR